MFIRIGNHSINMQAVLGAEWLEGEVVNVYLQGRSDAIIFQGEQTEQFKTAFDQLLTLEQTVQQTQMMMQQQREQMQTELAEKVNELNQKTAYVNGLAQELERQASAAAISKGKGMFKR